MFYVLPLCRSSYSLLYGTMFPEKLVSQAAELGYSSLALVDKNNLYGAYDFYFAARERGVKPIIGVELTTSCGDLILLAENHTGFENLSELVTYYQLQSPPDYGILSQFRSHLFCLTGNLDQTSNLHGIFGERLYINLDQNNTAFRYRIARKRKIKPIACPLVTFEDKADYSRHRLLRSIDGGYLVDNIPSKEMAGPNEFLQSLAIYEKSYNGFPEATDYSWELSERCQLQFPERKNILPDISIDENHFDKLKSDALAGLHDKITHPNGHYLARLEYELNIINRTGFTDYFLIVGDIVSFCHDTNIAVVGRGSAAGSLVAYALHITQVDPIKENLYFERFLNEARSDCPDIDLDIDWRRRDDLIEFVYEKYGRDHVAMIASYIHFQPRLAIREASKAMGIKPDDIDLFVKEISTHPMERGTLPADLPPRIRHRADIYLPVLNAARSIYGLPRHLGIHPGGIVITPRPIRKYIPLEKATKGIVVTQCDMYQAEKIGLVKIDLLGQRGLAVITDCHDEVRRLKGDGFRVPEGDPQTFDTFRSGKTIGVFQIESPGLRALLKDLQPQELNDITLALALIRPGASESGMKQVFLDRFHGLCPTQYTHPLLESVLAETHGVFIYQEQVLLAAREIAGFNLAASDLLRRAITKGRKKADRRKLKERFFAGASKNNIDRPTTEIIYNQLRQFAGYGFCKAHAATYGFLAYQSCYFKTHHPEIFMTAVLKNGGGYYPAAVYTAEARRLGIPIKPPDLNLSEAVDSLINKKIYLGINRVRDLGVEVIEQIVTNRPYHSLYQFIDKTRLAEIQMENLIKIGFFDSLETSRPSLLWEYRLWGKRKATSGGDLFSDHPINPELKKMPPLRNFSRFDIFQAERHILDIPASFHPLSLFETYTEPDANQLWQNSNGHELTITAWLADRKRIKTRSGKYMVFLTFDSLSDTFEVVLFPEIYHKYRDLIRKYRFIMVTGKVNREGGNVAIIAETMAPCPTGIKKAPYI